jgi:putative RecB family exonuclease
MPTHSHSSLERYERCPLAYRYRYVDRLKDRLGDSLEQYTGKAVHDTLEWLHLRVADGGLPLWEDIRDDFLRRYDRGWSDSIRLVHPERTREGYREVGKRCVRNYFENNTPFNQGSLIAAEWEFRLPLGDDGPWMTGRVDRVTRRAPGHIEVHDYKTGSFVPGRVELERSRQAALYAMAVRRAYPDVEDGRLDLVWHFLASGIVIRFEIRPATVERIRRETLELIDQVLATTQWPARPTRLCAWCEYGHVCPENEYREKVRQSIAGEAGPEPGVELVDRLSRLQDLRREVEAAYKVERAKLEAGIVEHADSEGVTVVLGSAKEAVVKDGKVRLRKRR